MAPSASAFAAPAAPPPHRQRASTCGRVAPPVRRVAVTARRNAGGAREKQRRRGDGRRPNRIGELIYRELAPIIEDAWVDASDAMPDVLVSVDGVTCSPDLRNARVRIKVSGSDKQRREVLKWLKESRKSLRHELAQCIHLKYVPELLFGESDLPSAERTVDLIEALAMERQRKEMVAPAAAAAAVSLDGGEDDELSILGDDDFGTIGPSYTMRSALPDADAEGPLEDVGDDESIVEVDDDEDDDLDERLKTRIYAALQNDGVKS